MTLRKTDAGRKAGPGLAPLLPDLSDVPSAPLDNSTPGVRV